MSTKRRRFHKHEGSAEELNPFTGPVTILVGLIIVAYLFVTNADPKGFEEYNFINTGMCLWLPLMVILFVLRQEPQQFGLTGGDRKLGFKWALGLWLAMLVPVVAASRMPAFTDQYLHGRLSNYYLFGLGTVFNTYTKQVNLKALLYYELSMGFYMFCWEFFFRGFLLFGLQKTRLKTWGAVIAQALPFMLLHWSYRPSASKPILEVLGSLPAALILGVVAIRTRSFLYGYLAHWAVSVTLDLFLLFPFIFRQIG